jgi:hypothetical protein
MEFYFDDTHWAIRYLVADTGGWLPGRKVLISPYAMAQVSIEQRQIAIHLTKQQIQDSPSIDNDKPVSRQFEEDYYGYFGWPIYWAGPYTWGYSPFVSHISTKALQDYESYKGSDLTGKAWNPDLRSTRHVTGYAIQAVDGEIGHVEDFTFNDETWEIRYLVVGTKNWWPGKRVLISPQWIDRVSWTDSNVLVRLTRDAIKEAPEYTDETLLSREYEISLHGHYNLKGYWVGEPLAKVHVL